MDNERLPSDPLFSLLFPKDILEMGTSEMCHFLLQSHSGDPIFRSKLMVVGYESVGKTTILDCLFPLEGYLAEG